MTDDGTAAAARQTRATSFGQVAELYDRRRPTYPDAAVDHVLAAAGDDPPPRRMVEVGCGTGKATVVFARRAPTLHITGVEPDAAMAHVAARNVPGADIHVARFEEWDAPSHMVGSVDIVASAQAWHWVDHAAAIPKAAALLRPGGVMAILANVPRDGGNDLRDVIDPVFEARLPGLVRTTGPLNWDGQFLEQAAGFRNSGLFDVDHEDEHWHHDWDQPLTSQEFGEFLRTHSDYIILEPHVVDDLVAGLIDQIDAAGGTIVMHYRTRVLLARRR